MEKISIKKELYILNYEFLNFYTIFSDFYLIFNGIFKYFFSENHEKGEKLPAADVASRADVATGPRRG